MKHKLRRNSLIIALVGSILIIGLHRWGAFVSFENRSLDYRFKIRGPENPKSPVVVIAMDDPSMEQIGKPPWRRNVHARLIDILTKADVSAIVFDVLFLDRDPNHPEDEMALARAIRRSGRTVSAFNFNYGEQTVLEQTGETVISTVTKNLPLPTILASSRMLGFVNAFQDSDGYLRRAHVVYHYENETHPALNVAAVSLAKNMSVEEVIRDLPMKDDNPYGWGYTAKELLINYRGGAEVFKTQSYANVLDGLIPADWLKGKIVLIGSTALGYFDHYTSPFQNEFPGVYFHANIIDNLWERDFLKPVNISWTILLIFAFGITSGILVPRTAAWLSAVFTIGLSGIFCAAGYFLMVRRLIYVELVAPTVSILGSYIIVFFYRFIMEQREKAGIKKAFGVYVNPHVVEQISKNPDGLKLGGELREMTVMFSDVAGFTSVSEKLTPQELVHLLNLYLTAMTDTIMRYDGTVDKYEGDAIMAFWGAPLLQPNHAKQACFAVLENRQRLAELNVELEKQGLHKLAARCGLNSGPMNVGNMGSTQKFNYTVMGDAVNLASRLEGANKQYETALMISETTYERSKNDIEARELDLLRVKGKKLPVKVFELVSKKGELTDSQKRGFDLYNNGLALYREHNFKEALKNFQQVQEFLAEDGPAKTYVQRTQNYIQSPPPEDWDGVFTMTTK